MRKIIYFDILCLTYILALSSQMLFFGLSHDKLFFKNDPLSFFLFNIPISFILSLLLILVVGVLLVFRVSATSIKRMLSVLFVSNIFFGFIVFTSETFVYKIDSLFLFFVFSLAVYAGCIALALKKEDIVSTSTKLSRAVTLILMGVFVSLKLYHWKKKSPADLKAGNVVLIILDGLSTKYLSPYSSVADTPGFDKIVQESILFVNARTNHSYTNRYFGTLYSGKKNRIPGKKNLLSLLNEAGVNTRWSIRQSNGVPDVQPGMKYKGFRSTYITEHFTWIPQMLGLDYNIYRYIPSKEKNLDKRLFAIRKYINDEYASVNPLETHLVQDIENLRNDKRPYFLLFYTNSHGQASLGAEIKRSRELWEIDTDRDNVEEIRKNMYDQNFVYSQGNEEHEKFVDFSRDQYRRKIKIGTDSLYRFFQTYKNRGWKDDTLLIITADHGKMFSKGKIWYSYHKDEEVARVPLVLSYKDLRGTDDRLSETIDISQTILEFFGIGEKLSKSAYSLLEKPEKDIVTTLTNTSHIRKEMFLSVYKASHKFAFNVYDHKKISFTVSEVNGFDEVLLADARQRLDSAGFSIEDIINQHIYDTPPKNASGIKFAPGFD